MERIIKWFAFCCRRKIINKNFNYKNINNFKNIFAFVKKFIISKDESIFIKVNGNKKLKENQINYLKKEEKKIFNNYDIKKNKKRIEKLSGKIAILKIVVINETKDRIDDEMCVIKVVVEKGVHSIKRYIIII